MGVSENFALNSENFGASPSYDKGMTGRNRPVICRKIRLRWREFVCNVCKATLFRGKRDVPEAGVEPARGFPPSGF